MIEFGREVTIAHGLLRPIVSSRQAQSDRLDDLVERYKMEKDYTKLLKVLAARAVKQSGAANKLYDPALRIARSISGMNIIGAGLETLVVHRDNPIFPTEKPVRKFATMVNGDAGGITNVLERRFGVAQEVLGDFIVPTDFHKGVLRGKQRPSAVIMDQPLIDIVGDGETDPRVADQRGVLRELATKLAVDEGLLIDVCPGHNNLATAQTTDGLQLQLVDTVIVSRHDRERFFLHYPVLPEEELGWISMLGAAA